jgi:hypothetical protein
MFILLYGYFLSFFFLKSERSSAIFCLSPISHSNVKLPYQHFLYELDMYQQFDMYQIYKALLPICAVDMWCLYLTHIGSHVERMVSPKEYHKIEMHGSI